MSANIVPIENGTQIRRRSRIRFAALTVCAAAASFGLACAAVLHEHALWKLAEQASAWAVAAPGVAGDPLPAPAPVQVSVPRAEAVRIARQTFARCAGKQRTTCVVDGDTLWLEGIKIRLADIDTPEISSPRCRAELERGERAADRLVALLNRGPLKVTRIDRDMDVYGRALRVVSVGGRSVGDMLIAEGLARRWDGARRPWC